MRYYPVLLDLAGRACVVVGGGTIAEGKAAPLVAAGARLTVIAPALTPALAAQHRAGRFAHVARAYERGDLAGAHLAIAATDDPAVNHAVHAEATERGVLINVVDDPAYCGFILPSILRRGDLLVAVSSSGHAPALAVRIRERLERELGDEYARFLELAAELRPRLARAYPAFEERKHLWYRLVDSDVLTLLRAGEEARARERIAEITGISANDASRDGPNPDPVASVTASRLNRRGAVYLVGAGPGDPKLITARGLELLRQADVVVYDRLVSRELLDEAPARAERVYVGKVPRGPCTPQEAINALLIREARLGRSVVRLKGGDPYVFGRGAEEAIACREAGVTVEVVPGVSSVLGATAAAGIPVTARGHAGGFAVITAHRAGPDDGHDWAALARLDTLVVLMGVERLRHVTERLLAHGRDPATPAAIVENGTLPAQRVIDGTLADIAGRAEGADIRAPALVVLGQVAALRALLAAPGGRARSAPREVADVA
ncbi:MAG TPA: siroheme synthase CysG [Gemmatimonadales bacterium]|nr:siroheme synthase CysG [Gemmatimonadales bacterium]